MFNISVFKTLVTNNLGRAGLVLSKHSPEIFLGTGIVSVVAGTILACRATLEIENILEPARQTMHKIDTVLEADIPEYPEEVAQRDKALVYVKTAVEITKVYLPSVGLIVLGFGLIVGSHNILTKRNAAIAAAYKLIETSFNKYRERVRDEYGEDTDKRLMLYEADKNEEVVKGKKGKKAPGVINSAYPYSFVWCEENSTQFQRSYSANLFFLRSNERFANDMLNSRGHVFLNEIFDDLGLKRTPEGAIVGWVKGYNQHNPSNDKYIDFGLNDPVNEEKGDTREAMIQPFYLNFNVDGPIYDCI